MDRTSACGADNIGSIPIESTKQKSALVVLFCFVFLETGIGQGKGETVRFFLLGVTESRLGLDSVNKSLKQIL